MFINVYSVLPLGLKRTWFPNACLYNSCELILLIFYYKKNMPLKPVCFVEIFSHIPIFYPIRKRQTAFCPIFEIKKEQAVIERISIDKG